MLACQKGHLPVISYLLEECKAEIDYICHNGSPLIMACQSGYINIVRELIENHSASVNLCDKIGFSPLLISVYSGNLELVKYLISKQAKIEVVGKNGCTLFHVILQIFGHFLSVADCTEGIHRNLLISAFSEHRKRISNQIRP